MNNDKSALLHSKKYADFARNHISRCFYNNEYGANVRYEPPTCIY